MSTTWVNGPRQPGALGGLRDLRLDAFPEPVVHKSRHAERSDRACSVCDRLGCAKHVTESSAYAALVYAEAHRLGYHEPCLGGRRKESAP